MSNHEYGKKAISFEEAVSELEQLVTKLEAGELPLEGSIDAYKKGVELVRFCSAQLDRVEKQVQILDGELLKPFSSEDQNGAEHD